MRPHAPPLCAPTSRDPGPEHAAAEHGQEGGQQGQVGGQGHGDPDGQRGAEPGVEPERGHDHRGQGPDHREPGEGDRLAHFAQRERHGVVDALPAAELLPQAEDEEQPVVGARAEQDHDEEDRGEVGDLHAEVGGLGDDRSGGEEGHRRGEQGDQRGQEGPEGEEQQGHDEQDREQLGQGLDVAVLVLLVDRVGHPSGQVQGQVGGRLGRGEGRSQCGHDLGLGLVPLGRGRRELDFDEGPPGLPVGRRPLIEDGGHPRGGPHGQLDPVDGGVVGRRQCPARGGGHQRRGPQRLRLERGGQVLGPDTGFGGRKELGVAALLDAGERGKGHGQDHRDDDPTGDDQPAKPYRGPSQGGEQAEIPPGLEDWTPEAQTGHRGGPSEAMGSSHWCPDHRSEPGLLGLSLGPRQGSVQGRPARAANYYEIFICWPAGGAAWGPPSRATVAG